ncbi:MAG: LamG domain-containing protein [Fuerstiella sp.]
MRFITAVCFWCLVSSVVDAQPTLIGHWPLQSTIGDQSPLRLKSVGTGVRFIDDGPTKLLSRSAVFDGATSVIDVAVKEELALANKPFSVAAWINVPEHLDDVPGDIVSRYDPETRTGFHVGLYSHGGVTNSQSNRRQLHFGIDQGRLESTFTDHGRLGSAIFVFALCVHDGQLYASTCSAGGDEAGHVFRFEGGDRWTDLGAPDKANAVSAMIEFDGALYVASSKYRLAGSALAESENPAFGGNVFRLGSDDQWIHCGRLSAETEAVASLVEFGGQLYAGSLYRPAGFFRYDGATSWSPCATPDGKRVEAMTVFNGAIYATCYDEGSVFRFDGDQWHHAGTIPEATQTYGFAVHQGSLFVSEWPQAHVYRYRGGTEWQDVGKLGNELEAMPLLVYNGKMYGGTLPLAEVHRYDGAQQWTRIGRVDHTPDVKYRRAWSMAVYQGRLFVGTLPSGRVLSIEAGRNVTWDRSLPAGWHHVAAVRDTDQIRLYIDGKPVAESSVMDGDSFQLNTDRPLQIGFGAQDHFHGQMADLRIYRGALPAEAIRQLAEKTK